MSTELMNRTWHNFSGSGSELALLMAIAEACNAGGNCALPLARLAAFARVCPSTAFVAVKALRMKRWIVTSRIQGQGGILVIQVNTPKLDRSRRPDCDEDPLDESDAVRAARKVKQRREGRMARAVSGKRATSRE